MDGAADPTTVRNDGFVTRRSRLRTAGALSLLTLVALVWVDL
jgi:hypothetical protein